MSESKLLKSVVIGAVAGAIISMFDRKTREHTIETTKKIKDKMIYYANNREQLQQLIEEKVDEVQELYEKASENVSLIVNTIEEVKEIPESIQHIVNDTKQAFSEQNKTISE
ncbi:MULTISPECIES: YtxH domain-containing protein [Lysinibacillus]|uniref:YtxH domain-containing protein n=1 Tax=Lysinibacillus antri TaxID=2498145 RepID=A0A432LAM9_9BACI|nr:MULTISPECIES: YtxH domain-containing protein [Lysinibacillus]RUL51598.1 YtxH domain-containing protein [Lysinibacillus antri]TSI10639.1 YtxH domain-containing protein [Lysinibacillus sp. BW-2-10]